MLEMIQVGIGLMLLMASNIVMGSYIAWANGDFDRKTLFTGIKKGSLIILVFIMIYIAGYLNKNLLAIPLGDTSVNLIDGLYTGTVVVFIAYSVQVIRKLMVLIAPSKEEQIQEMKAEIQDLEEEIEEK